ncbi:NUDIX hydrolase [Streptomyces sp. ISL-98]|uniref:NUDIX domain-containing protein n=1 Tax=Streptomyces sp. ISL-98 TaxID=2819192 RepID=UPI001BE8B89D|nr:NUDIX hydrolase [Streptomyces sp. ISL-98]MBT2511455.1 NUDIX hydrolase [Streptomyces sp. ISL-98]
MTDISEYDRGLPRKRVAAGMLSFDDKGQVLLVDPVYKEPWKIPGGAVEADESPRAAAQREVKEELGLTTEPGRLLGIDWTAERPGRSEGIVMIFDGDQLHPGTIKTIQLDPTELRAYAFVPLDQLDSKLIPNLARRVRTCTHAHTQGTTTNMENGTPAT